MTDRPFHGDPAPQPPTTSGEETGYDADYYGPGYYPDPSVPGFVRYWGGAGWVPGTSRPAPEEGELLEPPRFVARYVSQGLATQAPPQPSYVQQAPPAQSARSEGSEPAYGEQSYGESVFVKRARVEPAHVEPAHVEPVQGRGRPLSEEPTYGEQSYGNSALGETGPVYFDQTTGGASFVMAGPDGLSELGALGTVGEFAELELRPRADVEYLRPVADVWGEPSGAGGGQEAGVPAGSTGTADPAGPGWLLRPVVAESWATAEALRPAAPLPPSGPAPRQVQGAPLRAELPGPSVGTAADVLGEVASGAPVEVEAEVAEGAVGEAIPSAWRADPREQRGLMETGEAPRWVSWGVPSVPAQAGGVSAEALDGGSERAGVVDGGPVVKGADHWAEVVEETAADSSDDVSDGRSAAAAVRSPDRAVSGPAVEVDRGPAERAGTGTEPGVKASPEAGPKAGATAGAKAGATAGPKTAAKTGAKAGVEVGALAARTREIGAAGGAVGTTGKAASVRGAAGRGRTSAAGGSAERGKAGTVGGAPAGRTRGAGGGSAAAVRTGAGQTVRGRTAAEAAPAGLGRRLVAWVVDIAVVAVVGAAAGVPLVGSALEHLREKVSQAEYVAATEGHHARVWLVDPVTLGKSGALLAVLLLLALVYEVVPVSRTGQTFGKRLARLRVVDAATARPPGFGRSLFRWLVKLLGTVLLLGLLAPLFDRRARRGWQDRAARTRVVRA